MEVDDSVGHLDKLEVLNLRHCYELQALPSCLTMKSLQYFHIFGCRRLKKFPDILHEMKGVRRLSLIGTGISELPPSFGNLTGLERFVITARTTELIHLPSSIYNLQHLETLTLEGNIIFPKGFSKYFFPRLRELRLDYFTKGSEIDFIINCCCPLTLEELTLWETGISELPPSSGNLTGLKVFDITAHSTEVIHLPGSIYNLQHLETLILEGNIIFPKGFSNYVFPRLRTLLLRRFTKGSEIDFIFNCCCPLTLEELEIGSCEKIVTLPKRISRFERLHRLRIYSCDGLQEIPRLPRSIRYVDLDVSNCHSLDSQSLFHQVSLSLSQSY